MKGYSTCGSPSPTLQRSTRATYLPQSHIIGVSPVANGDHAHHHPILMDLVDHAELAPPGRPATSQLVAQRLCPPGEAFRRVHPRESSDTPPQQPRAESPSAHVGQQEPARCGRSPSQPAQRAHLGLHLIKRVDLAARDRPLDSRISAMASGSPKISGSRSASQSPALSRMAARRPFWSPQYAGGAFGLLDETRELRTNFGQRQRSHVHNCSASRRPVHRSYLAATACVHTCGAPG